MVGLGLNLGLTKGGLLGSSVRDIVPLFPIAPTYTISGSGTGGYTTNYNPASDKPSGTEGWIATTGNDTTGDGSEGNPWRTLAKAETEGVTVFNIKTGDYWRNDGLAASYNPSRDVAFVAVDGPGTVRMGRVEDPSDITWTSEGSGAYSTTLASVRAVLDLSATGEADYDLVDGTTPVPIPFTSVANLAAVQASSGNTWAQSGSTLYVKTFDSRAPDSDVLPLIAENNFSIVNKDITVYMEGIETWGDRAMFMDYGDIAQSAKCVTVDCGFRYANADCYYHDKTSYVRAIRTHATHSLTDDGFNYDRTGAQTNVNNPDMDVLEVDCVGVKNGTGTTDNGSTTHDAVNIVRLNGIYNDNPGPGVIDTENAFALNLGVTANNNEDGFAVGTFLVGQPAVQINKDCTATGNNDDDLLRTTGGIQISLGGNTFTVKTSQEIDGTLPGMQSIILGAYNKINHAYGDIGTGDWVRIQSLGIDDFLDFGPANREADAPSANRATVVADATLGIEVADFGDATNDIYYQTATSETYRDQIFVARYKDGTDTTFDAASTLMADFAGTAQLIQGSSGTDDLTTTNSFAAGVRINGGAETTQILPMPYNIYRFTAASNQSFRMRLYGTGTAGEGMQGEAGPMLSFKDELTAAEYNTVQSGLNEFVNLTSGITEIS